MHEDFLNKFLPPYHRLKNITQEDLNKNNNMLGEVFTLREIDSVIMFFLDNIIHNIDEETPFTMTDEMKQSLISSLDAFTNITNEIFAFPKKTDLTQSDRTNICSSTKTRVNALANALMPHVTLCLAKKGSLKQTRDDALAYKRNISDSIKIINQLTDEATSLVAESKDIVAKQGLDPAAAFFKFQARKHDNSAICWLVATFMIAALLLYGLFWAIENPFLGKQDLLEKITSAQAVNSMIDISGKYLLGDTYKTSTTGTGNLQMYLLWSIIATKVLVFAVLSYILSLCVKNFMAHRHNAVVNQHKENALNTYRKFVRATQDDPEVRNIILNHAASNIYQPQDSGYLKGSNSAPIPNVIEVATNIAKTNGAT